MNRRRGAQPPEISQLLSMLDQAYDHRSWHGTNLRGSIRGMSPRRAAWRPSAGRHNIWEIVVHAAYWKYAAWRRLTRAPRGAFPLEGSNWFRRPPGGDASDAAWRADVALLDDMHTSLRAAVANLTAGGLRRRHKGSADSSFSLVAGVIAHDVYHAGQIQLLKRLGARQ